MKYPDEFIHVMLLAICEKNNTFVTVKVCRPSQQRKKTRLGETHQIDRELNLSQLWQCIQHKHRIFHTLHINIMDIPNTYTWLFLPVYTQGITNHFAVRIVSYLYPCTYIPTQ